MKEPTPDPEVVLQSRQAYEEGNFSTTDELRAEYQMIRGFQAAVTNVIHRLFKHGYEHWEGKIQVQGQRLKIRIERL